MESGRTECNRRHGQLCDAQGQHDVHIGQPWDVVMSWYGITRQELIERLRALPPPIINGVPREPRLCWRFITARVGDDDAVPGAGSQLRGRGDSWRSLLGAWRGVSSRGRRQEIAMPALPDGDRERPLVPDRKS